jgi:ATP-dependent Lon protease
MSARILTAAERLRREGKSDLYTSVNGYSNGVLVPARIKEALDKEALDREGDDAAGSGENEGWCRQTEVNEVVDLLKACAPSSKRMIKVFDKVDEDEIKTRIKRTNSDHRDRVGACFKAIASDDGMRKMPEFKGIGKALSGLKKSFGNFTKVIDEYEEELSLAGASKPEVMRIAPVILDGEPGVGKTAFAQAFAAALGMPFLKLSAGGMQHAAVLNGTAMHWGNSQQGAIFEMLGFGNSASGVILIDEVDKLNDRSNSQILPALLDLLEPETSRTYRDESLGINFNASHLITVMTSNVLENINEALLSRCKVTKIAMPGVEQKLAVAVGEHKKINESLPKAKRTQLDMSALGTMVKTDMDIRALIIAIRKSCAVALSAGGRVAVPVIEVTDKFKKKHPFGFLSN